MLDTIAARTGVDTNRLHKMTLSEWAPIIQKDEGMEGFGTSRQLSATTLRKTKQQMIPLLFLCCSSALGVCSVTQNPICA